LAKPDDIMTAAHTRFALLPDRGLIRLFGPDAKGFLQALVSNDIARLDGQRAIYAALLTPQGKYLHDFFVVALADALWLDCERARQADLQRRLTLYRLRSKVDISDASGGFAVAAIFGGDAPAALGLPPEAGHGRDLGGGIVYVDPRLTALGARAILPASGAGAALGAMCLGQAAEGDYDAHRLTLGVPDGSRDLEVEKTLLLEAQFEALHGVDFAKGCYVGQELTARTKYRGLLKRRIYQVEGEGPLPAADTPVMHGAKEAGVMRTSRGRTGLALLRIEQVEAAEAAGESLLAAGVRVRTVSPAWAGS
jgi:tRNA-modifying protein YgfZ